MEPKRYTSNSRGRQRCQSESSRLPSLSLLLLGFALLVAAPAAAFGPAAFEPNLGQADASVVFLARCRGYQLFLAGGRIDLALGKPASPSFHRVGLELVGADRRALLRGVEPLPGRSHYYRGADPNRWLEDVPHFGSVVIEDVYPGIRVVIHGTADGELEFDLVLEPGADPAAVSLRQRGADDQRLDEEGNLELAIGGERFLLHRPLAYQELNGRRLAVAADFMLKEDGRVAFHLGPYDRSASLTIDPVLAYSTYFGGSRFEGGYDIALDADGNMYLTGFTQSTDFPTELPAQSDRGGTGTYVSDAFVSKLSADGQTLLFSTYLGGDGDDEGRSIAIDPGGPVWVTGMTESSDFPLQPTSCMPAVSCPVQGSPGGGKDAFVARFSAGGALQYSTYLGGSADENFIARTGAIAVDGTGNPYIVGETQSANFPTHNPLQEDLAGERDAFAVKLTPSGGSYVYSTFVGTSNLDVAHDAVVDAAGDLYAAGRYASDPWVFELNPAGNALLIDRTISTGNSDWAEGLAVDATGAIYLVGTTQAFQSSSFPLVHPFQGIYGGGTTDGYLVKLDPSGQIIVYATLLGGSDQDRLYDVDLDSNGNMIVAGSTLSTDFPVRSSVHPAKSVPGNSADIVVSVLDPGGSSLLFSTYLGGTGTEQGEALAVDDADLIHLTGSTQSSDLPTVAAYDDAWNSGADVFVMTLEVPLFADGFESGDVTAWSASLP